jgi:hypothetical protein
MWYVRGTGGTDPELYFNDLRGGTRPKDGLMAERLPVRH